uniref:Uncharacterized protein n=1 Tax=Physcomitrium patens TaxID=3218 RepID=A0A2K1L0A6_PHYPA|nr:hypothetical protein PHYPA_002245 [Physcomitrium patens]
MGVARIESPGITMPLPNIFAVSWRTKPRRLSVIRSCIIWYHRQGCESLTP